MMVRYRKQAALLAASYQEQRMQPMRAAEWRLS